MKVDVGTRIRATRDIDNRATNGMAGTVEYNANDQVYRILFDEFMDGWSTADKSKTGRVWYLTRDEFEPIGDES